MTSYHSIKQDSLFNIIFKEFVSLAGKDMIPYTSGMCKQEKNIGLYRNRVTTMSTLFTVNMAMY